MFVKKSDQDIFFFYENQESGEKILYSTKKKEENEKEKYFREEIYQDNKTGNSRKFFIFLFSLLTILFISFYFGKYLFNETMLSNLWQYTQKAYTTVQDIVFDLKHMIF